MSKYPAHPVQCPYGNHPIFVRPNGSIVAHYADNEMRQRCKGSEETYCDCHLHTQQVCDLCQRVNHTKAFYADKNAVEVLEPGDPRRYTKDRAEAIVRNVSVDVTKPHWRCKCGSIAMPLTDDTRCKCGDIYEQEWSRVDPVATPVCQACGEKLATVLAWTGNGKNYCDWCFPPFSRQRLIDSEKFEGMQRVIRIAQAVRANLPGTYIACGDHYYACVRGDEECPACAREKVLTSEIAALRDAVSPNKCNVGPDYYIRVAQRMRAREMRIIPLEVQPLVGDKIE